MWLKRFGMGTLESDDDGCEWWREVIGPRGEGAVERKRFRAAQPAVVDGEAQVLAAPPAGGATGEADQVWFAEYMGPGSSKLARTEAWGRYLDRLFAQSRSSGKAESSAAAAPVVVRHSCVPIGDYDRYRGGDAASNAAENVQEKIMKK